MSYSINNSINLWLNSPSYEEWVKNAENLYEDIVHLDGHKCVKLFNSTVLEGNSRKKLADLPFAKWSLSVKVKDSKMIDLLQKKLNDLILNSETQDKLFLEMINPAKLLIDAVLEDNTTFIQDMANAGIDFNVQDKNEATPLFCAAVKGKLEIVSILLKAGADPNIADADGDTALMQAAGNGDIDCVRALLENEKTEINRVNKSGHHAVSFACVKGHEEIVKLLLDHQADINLQNSLGRTILVQMMFYNHSEVHQRIIEMLVSKLDVKELGLHREIIRLVSVAHCTNGVGVSELRAKDQSFSYIPVELEGAHPQYWMKKMGRATKLFSECHPELLQESISDQLVQLLNTGIIKSNQEILIRHREGLPVALNAGTNQHAVVILIWGKHFILCNRGEGFRKVLEAFQFVPENLTDEILNLISKVRSQNEEAYSKFFFQELPQLLKFQKTGFEEDIEKVSVLPPQTSGNCSWASLEQAVLTYFMLNEFLADSEGRLDKIPPMNLDRDVTEEVKKKFDEWAAFNQMYHLERYLDSNHLRKKSIKSVERRSLYLIDNPLLLSSIRSIVRTIPWKSERLENLNHILAKTITFDEQDGELNYARAKKVMDSLFEPNAEDVVKEFTDRIQKK